MRISGRFYKKRNDAQWWLKQTEQTPLPTHAPHHSHQPTPLPQRTSFRARFLFPPSLPPSSSPAGLLILACPQYFCSNCVKMFPPPHGSLEKSSSSSGKGEGLFFFFFFSLLCGRRRERKGEKKSVSEARVRKVAECVCMRASGAFHYRPVFFTAAHIRSNGTLRSSAAP
jgi:hypothetical protein